MFWLFFWGSKSSNSANSSDKKEMNSKIKKVKEVFEKYNKSCPALLLERNWHGVTWVRCEAWNREVNHSMSVSDFFWGWSFTRYARYKCFTNKHKECPYRKNLPVWKGDYKVMRNKSNNLARDEMIKKIKMDFGA